MQMEGEVSCRALLDALPDAGALLFASRLLLYVTFRHQLADIIALPAHLMKELTCKQTFHSLWM